MGLGAKVLAAVTLAVLTAGGGVAWLCSLAVPAAGPGARTVAACAVLALCAVASGYWVLWRIVVHPLRRLGTAARRASGSGCRAAVGAERDDEIGQLAEGLDAAFGALAAFTEELMLAKAQPDRLTADDTEDLELANRRLREELAEKEYFLRAVSHDLNAPMRNISGMAAMAILKHGDQLPQELAARLKRIQANADMASEMISELLDLSRVQSLPKKRQIVEVSDLIAEQARMFEFELNSHKMTLEVVGQLPVLYADRAMLRKAFQNLIDNAIKYMDKTSGGRVEVSYARVGDFHRFCVADNGPGIPPAVQESIFRPFHRAATAPASRVAGKGVGLATVAAVAAGYGGKAWVESVPAQGARFYISLRVDKTQVPAQHSAAQVAKTGGESAGRNHRAAGSARPSGNWRTT